jgi:predicted regulator of Ras-like GTPase activity (Roadblock/LC7/MglB family)|eukprot:20223-Heterococcus_DN1.PRE.3
MLRAKHIPATLNLVNCDGVKASMLLQRDGALLGSAGPGLAEIDDKIIAAIVSNIWAEFETSGTDRINGGELKATLLQLEGGRLGIACTGGDYLVCLYASDTVKFGLIKAKLEALHRYYDERLRQLAP